MKKIKLMIVIWDLGQGGIQKRMRDVVLELSKNNQKIYVYLIIRKKVVNGFADLLVNKKNVVLIYCPFEKPSQSLIFFSFWLMFKYIFIKPDIVLSFLAHYASVVGIIRKIVFWHRSRFVINEGVVTSSYLKMNNFEFLKPYVRIFYNTADLVIVPSLACKQDLISNFNIRPNLLTVIPSWTLVKKSMDRAKLYDLIFIGRFTEEKDPIAFIEIIQLLCRDDLRIKAIMIGDGHLRNKVINTIKESKLEDMIVFIPFEVKPIRYLKKSKILVVTSKNEGLPNVVLEAGMCNIPTVTFNFPGANEVVISHKTGYIVDNINQAKIQIRKLLLNHNLCERLGNNANFLVKEKFSKAIQDAFISNVLSYKP
jgi:glycosyltransferase involved in cell wall biosynthesis